jgi:O-antigen/teichoic acid export membrane protein
VSLAGRIFGLFEDYGLGSRQTAKLTFDVLINRIAPGVINVGVLFVLATWLSREAYGLASTFMATATVAATFLYGPILQPALVQHAEREEGVKQRRFEHRHATNSLLLSVLIGLVGVPLAMAGLFDWRVVAATAAFGFYTAILQLSRSRLQFYRFGLGSSSQSIAFLALSYLLVKPDPTVNNTLEAFAGSYLIGAAISGALVGMRFARPNLSLIKESLSMGTAATFSGVSGNAFTLACRYLLIALGHTSALGTFSFSLDLAQKTVGIFLNIATFGIVPHALKSRDVRHLWRSLARGSLIALLVASMSAGFILILALTPWIAALNGPLYDPISFVLISLGVMINRTGRMMLMPVAMRVRKTNLQLWPILAMAPLGVLFVLAGTAAQLPYTVEWAYLLTLTAWTVGGYWLLLPPVRAHASG